MMSQNLSLGALWPVDVLESVLADRANWHPYPPIEDRAAWEGLPENARQSLVAGAEAAARLPWPHVPASVYLEYSVDGNRTHYEALHFGRRQILSDLVLGECAEGQGRWLNAILDAAWSICEESSWCLPAHVGVQQAGVGLPDVAEPTVDLFAAETGALLAWTNYLLENRLRQLSPRLPERIQREVDARILTPALAREDCWWMGFTPRRVNNWNPWINSNWLACALLLEQDPRKRLRTVAKILRSLDRFLADYPRDGGCDEGPNYWGRAGASLFDSLELLLNASDGRLDAFGDELVRNIGQFIYRAHIAGDFYLNFADASAVVEPEAELVFRYGKCIQDEGMCAYGAWLAQRLNLLKAGPVQRSPSLGRELAGVFCLEEMGRAAQRAPLLGDIWLPNIEVFAARDRSGSEEGFYVAGKGGHNEESHNHNDVGHFVVFRQGCPLIIDAGVETYTRKTFSAQRYEIWTMQSAYHSLPTIAGIQQAPGRTFRSGWVNYKAGKDQVTFELEIAPAYPPEANLTSWQRKLTFTRGKGLELSDHYEFSQVPSSLSLSLMTASEVDLSMPGWLRFGAVALPGGRMTGTCRLGYDSARFEVRLERVPVLDERMSPVWGTHVTRILFEERTPAASGSWTFTFME